MKDEARTGALWLRGLWFGLVGTALVAACVFAVARILMHEEPSSSIPPPSSVPSAMPSLFRDVTAGSGVDWTYRNGEEAGHYSILETVGGGVALLDFDGDGLLDIFLTGGGFFEGPDKKQIRGHPNRLYRNLGGWKFQDVTAAVGLDAPVFYGHGVAVCDYDRDGFPDLLVTGFGRLALYHNVADGKGGRRFVDVTESAGLPQGLWTTSAAWADLDGDGFPDLYLCQYLDWSFANDPRCPGYSSGIARDVCPPSTFRGLPHKLFRNQGNGTFADVSKEAGLFDPRTAPPTSKGGAYDPHDGKGLGVIVVDVNGDGRPDIYVANDAGDNFLYLNRSRPGKLQLEEVGLHCGVARDGNGQYNGSMGVDAADWDGSGRPALFVTNYERELHALYRNEGNGFFQFCTGEVGIASIGTNYVGFGTAFVDVDNDGWEDLVISNGHVIRHPTLSGVRQLPVLFQNVPNAGGRRFQDITPQGGPYFRAVHGGRGLAVGDLDNDGRPDLVISHVNEPAALLRNEAGAGHRWLGVELADPRGDVVGARVTVEVAGRRLTRYVKGGGSYLSANDHRLLFGLGDADGVTRVTVDWPWGRGTQQWDGKQLSTGTYVRLVAEK